MRASVTCDANACGLGVTLYLIVHPDIVIHDGLQIEMGRMWSLVA